MIDVAQKQADGESLVREYVKTGNEHVKEQAIEAFLPLVKYIVDRLNIPTLNTLKKNDLFQFGIVGLLKAMENFDPGMGIKFKTFGYKRIQGEIIDAVRQQGLISRQKLSKLQAIETAMNRLHGLLGRDPTVYEICNELGCSEKEYHDAMASAQLNYMLSLDDNVRLNGEDSLPRVETIADIEQNSPEEIQSESDIREELRGIIQNLPERKRLVLALYFYEELTLADIGLVLGLTESRVSQIMNQTLIEIRSRMNF